MNVTCHFIKSAGQYGDYDEVTAGQRFSDGAAGNVIPFSSGILSGSQLISDDFIIFGRSLIDVVKTDGSA